MGEKVVTPPVVVVVEEVGIEKVRRMPQNPMTTTTLERQWSTLDTTTKAV